ncbi:hypothetical protein ACWDUX_15710 [Streptomyces sp. NPDC003444]
MSHGNDHSTREDGQPTFLLDRVRFDLASVGFYMAPPEPLSDDHQATVDWLTHQRLDAAALDMVEADRLEEDIVTRYDTVRTTMNTALATVLHAFGYRTSRPLFGTGFTVQPPRTTP